MHDMKVCILYAYVKEPSDGDERDIIPDEHGQCISRGPHPNLPILSGLADTYWDKI